MDTEEGVEVVWNEVQFSERKNYKLQEVGHGGRKHTAARHWTLVCSRGVAEAGMRACWGHVLLLGLW